MNGRDGSRGYRYLLTREFIVQFAVFAAPIGIATAFAIFVFYHFDVQMVRHNLHETENHHLLLRDVLIRQNVRSALTALRSLADLHESQGSRPRDSAGLTQTLAQEFGVFCKQFEAFRRIRAIDIASGRETADVRCLAEQPSAKRPLPSLPALDDSLLAGLRGLEAKDIYISDLMVQHDEPGGRDRDSVPVVLFAAPLRVSPGNERSIVVADVDMRHLVSDLMLDTGQGGKMILVESDGRFVRKPTGSERWGDTLSPGRELSFAREYPEVWEQLQRSPYGTVVSAKGLFTFATIDLTDTIPAPSETGAPGGGLRLRAPVWRIVSHIAGEEITAGQDASIRKAILLIPAPFLVALYLAQVAVRRRRTARDLEESERYLRQIMDSVVDGIVTTDPSGRIEQANAAIPTLFGFGSSEEMPDTLSQLIPYRDLREDGELAHFWNAEGGPQRPVRMELDLRRQDGTAFPAEVVLMGTVLGGGRRFIWLIRDVSERHVFEAERNAARMRFFHQTKMAEIGLIAAGIIHEVGNPIAAISGMLNEIEDEATDVQGGWSDQTREKLKLISEQAQRLEGITREISDFVRSRPGVAELFDINSLIRSTLRLVSYDARWKLIRVDKSLDATIPAIFGIQDQCAQLLMNLLVNAGDALQDRPDGQRQVTVRTENRQEFVLLTIADNGQGMSEETRMHAFDPFFTTKPEGKGTGLGLSLCQSIVEAHHGSIELESSEGAGATFRISFPAPVSARAITG